MDRNMRLRAGVFAAILPFWILLAHAANRVEVEGGVPGNANRNTAIVDADGGLKVVPRARSGTPSIISTTLTGGNTSYTGSVSGIRLFATGADATFKIFMSSAAESSGTTSPNMTLRSGVGADIEPDYFVKIATVTWLSGTLDVVIEGTR